MVETGRGWRSDVDSSVEDDIIEVTDNNMTQSNPDDQIRNREELNETEDADLEMEEVEIEEAPDRSVKSARKGMIAIFPARQ